MLAPIVIPAPAVAASILAFLAAAWWLNRWLSTPLPAYPTWQVEREQHVGRHRVAADRPAYRPGSANTTPGPVVVPGYDPIAAEDWAVNPPADMIDQTITAEYGAALREDWAREKVAAAGMSWETHTAKFTGAVLPRDDAPATPDDWFGVPTDETRVLDAVQ